MSVLEIEFSLFSLTDKHIVEIEVTGPLNPRLNQHFKCTTIRSNPAQVGHVTGTQTYDSFYNSLLGKKTYRQLLILIPLRHQRHAA